MENKYFLELENISKSFGPLKANDNISLKVKKGEIHALLGENGAGKSTLMSILFGLYQPDKGEIKKNGRTVKIRNPNDATRLGIGMVHQHFKLVENFTVVENVMLGMEPCQFGFLKRSEAEKRIKELSERYHLQVEPKALVGKISVGMQQRVELLKMLYRENEILIFDEPTAVLTPQEVGELLQIMKGFAAEGKSILFITHKLEEIMAAADRCTVLCKGSYIGTVEIQQTTKEELSRMMVGREVKLTVEKQAKQPGEQILSVEQLTVTEKHRKKPTVQGVSFTIHSGEIVGVAGIDGNGQMELVYALTGLLPVSSGKILLQGKDMTKTSVKTRSLEGISHIPEDRHKHGLVLDFSLAENMVLKRYHEPQFAQYGFLKEDAIKEYTNRLLARFDVRCANGTDTIVRSMSGGNQQKAVIAREVDRKHSLLIAVQPTRGLDVGAIEFVHRELVECRDHGNAVLLVSLELEEILNVSDRILVMYEGKVVGEFNPKTTTVQELGYYMAGAKENRQ